MLKNKLQNTRHLMVYQWTYQKLLRSPSTHIFYALGAACSVALCMSFMLAPGMDNAVNASGLLNYYNIWFIINMPISLLFIFLKTMQIFREEIEDGTILLIIVKPYSRSKIYGEKILGLCVILSYYLICSCLLPLIMGFANFQIYNLNSPLIAFQHWMGMFLTVIVMDIVFIAISCFLNLVMSSKALLAFASFLIIIGVPLSLSDLIMEASSSKEQQTIALNYETANTVMAMQTNYYSKNPWLSSTFSNIENINLSKFIIDEINPLFAPCGKISWITPNVQADVNKSFSISPSDISSIFANIHDKNKLEALKLFNAFSSKYAYRMSNGNYNLALSLYMTTITSFAQFQGVATITSPFAASGIDDKTYVDKLNSFNTIIQWCAWLNPVKQWRMMFNEFSVSTTDAREFQGFPNFAYKYHYVKDDNQKFHTDLNQTSNLINYALANVVWVILSLLITSLACLKRISHPKVTVIYI